MTTPPENPPAPIAPPATPAPIAPSGRCPRAWMVLFITVLLALAADLGSKWWMFRWIGPVPQEVDRAAVVRVLEADPSHIMSLIQPHQPRVIVPKLLNVQLVLNAGAVFGTGQGKRWFFIGFTGVALAFALWIFARWTPARDRVAQVAVGLVIAGGLGNLYDRAMYACVRDFIHPLPGWQLPFGLSWPGGERDVWPYVSNVADALLLIGIGVLMVKLWRAEGQHRRA